MLRIMLYAIPFPYITCALGWTVTELGRQPWIVYGLMKTTDAVSPVAASQVGISLVAFVLVYSLLGIAAFTLMARSARQGPQYSCRTSTFRKGGVRPCSKRSGSCSGPFSGLVYFMLDGFDLGLGTLMPFLGKNDTERRIIYNAMGPFWDGNEVWLITAGGVTFAAFPGTYAVLFSAFYSPLMFILFALIIRAAAFEFRAKLPGKAWRSLWDVCMALGSFVPALLLGVAFANIFRGIPIDGEGVYHGEHSRASSTSYGLLGGLLFLFLFLVHGALWLAVKSEGILQQRAIRYAKSLWIPLVIVAVLFLAHTWFETGLYYNYTLIPALFLVPFNCGPRAFARSRLSRCEGMREGMACVLPDHYLCHAFWRDRALSEHAHFKRAPRVQSDGLQRGIEPRNAHDHARCSGHLRTPSLSSTKDGSTGSSGAKFALKTFTRDEAY